MNQNETLRAKQLSRAIVALSNGIKAKEVKKQSKNLDFLNLPKPQKPKVIDAKKNLDYLQKRTGLPIPKKEQPKEKDLKFVDRLSGISHSEITQDTLIDHLYQKVAPQLGAIKADFLNEVNLLRSESLQREADKLIISDELVKVFLQKLKNLSEKDKLDVTDLRNFQSFIYGNRKYRIEELMHGGSETLQAGTNVTITHNGGTATISASGAALAIIPVTGTIDDSNVTFTSVTLPALLNINGAFYQQTGGAITWSRAGTTITLSSPVGIGGSIFGI